MKTMNLLRIENPIRLSNIKFLIYNTVVGRDTNNGISISTVVRVISDYRKTTYKVVVRNKLKDYAKTGGARRGIFLKRIS